MTPLFGRYEAAALLAVERANGGELAGLEQVLNAYEQLFGSTITAGTFSDAVTLLVDAGLVEWSDGLCLTYEGRKVIRHSGLRSAEDFPGRVTRELQKIDEGDLAPEGELPAPSEEDVARAMGQLRRGNLSGNVPVPGGTIAPSGMAGRHTIGARLTTGLPAGLGLSVAMPGATPPPAPEPPLVSPFEDHYEDDTDGAERDETRED